MMDPHPFARKSAQTSEIAKSELPLDSVAVVGDCGSTKPHNLGNPKQIRQFADQLEHPEFLIGQTIQAIGQISNCLPPASSRKFLSYRIGHIDFIPQNCFEGITDSRRVSTFHRIAASSGQKRPLRINGLWQMGQNKDSGEYRLFGVMMALNAGLVES